MFLKHHAASTVAAHDCHNTTHKFAAHVACVKIKHVYRCRRRGVCSSGVGVGCHVSHHLPCACRLECCVLWLVHWNLRLRGLRWLVLGTVFCMSCIRAVSTNVCSCMSAHNTACMSFILCPGNGWSHILDFLGKYLSRTGLVSVRDKYFPKKSHQPHPHGWTERPANLQEQPKHTNNKGTHFFICCAPGSFLNLFLRFWSSNYTSAVL